MTPQQWAQEMLRRGTKLANAKQICQRYASEYYEHRDPSGGVYREPRPKSVFMFYRQAFSYLSKIKE